MDAPCHSRYGAKDPSLSTLSTKNPRSQSPVMAHWHLHMSEKFSSGMKNLKQTNLMALAFLNAALFKSCILSSKYLTIIILLVAKWSSLLMKTFPFRITLQNVCPQYFHGVSMMNWCDFLLSQDFTCGNYEQNTADVRVYEGCYKEAKKNNFLGHLEVMNCCIWFK